MITLKQLQQYAEPDIIKRGAAYVAQGKVAFAEIRLDEPNLLVGEVRGQARYTARIYAHDPLPDHSKSSGNFPLPDKPAVSPVRQVFSGTCTCPYNGPGWCKHLAALAIANIHGQVTVIAPQKATPRTLGESFQRIKDLPPSSIENALFQLIVKRPHLHEELLDLLTPKGRSHSLIWPEIKEQIADALQQLAPMLLDESVPYITKQKEVAQQLFLTHDLTGVYGLQQLLTFLQTHQAPLDLFHDQQAAIIFGLSKALISPQEAIAALTLIFDAWAKLDRIGKVPADYWTLWTPLIIAFTADPVVIHFLKTQIQGYSLDWEQFPGLADWLEELGERS